VFYLSISKDRASEIRRYYFTILTGFGVEVGEYINGFYCRPTKIKRNDSIWVIVDRLMKLAHFLSVKTRYTVDILGKIYIREIVRIFGIPVSIVSDRDSSFTSRFWRTLQKALGTQLDFSSAYHPQTNGQTERVYQVLEDTL